MLVDIVGRMANDKFDSEGPVIQEAKGWMVVVGDGDVLPCIEMAIRFMQTGETSRVWSHSKYAMGNGTRSYQVDGGTCQLPPSSSVMYEIKVIMIVLDTSRLNPYFTIQKATTQKSIANDIYQYEWCPPAKSNEDPSCEMAMSRALRLYSKAAKDMGTLLDGTYFAQVEKEHPQRHQTKQLMMDCLNNVVAVHLRQHQYHKAKKAAVEVLRHDPNNIKALLRAAKAALLDPASTLEEVDAALKAAEGEITYKNPAEEKQLKQLKAQFKKKRHEYKEQSKAMFGDKLKADNAFASDDPVGDKSGTSQEEQATNMSKSVSFDESTTKPPNENGRRATATADIKGGDNESFWKKQGFTMMFQAILPMIFFFIYRFITKTVRIGEDTIASNQAQVPQVDEEVGQAEL